MDAQVFLERMRRSRSYAGQIEHVEILPEREGKFAQPSEPLPAAIAAALAARGIAELYSHQAQCLELSRAGRDWVVVTGTASGKTLCYHLPILERLLAEPEARALYLFPTKALAQDQFKGLLELLDASGHGLETAIVEPLARLRPGVFDGDTPTAQRRRIKAEANLVLSNPDMLHASILPYHAKWSRFFENLRYVVVDEVHTYRGILGAHVGCVLRRLMRVCEHYGSRPSFLCASATIANPGELTSKLIGREAAVVDDDGAPRGRKYFVLWNPTPLGKDHLARRAASDDAVDLMIEALLEGGQALAFTRTRQAAELIHRYVSERLEQAHSPLAKAMRAYRGGYLPNERRQIEADLFAGRLRGVAATNALELGIDVGSLDVALLVGYPGTIASAWQQAGRSGRRRGESLAVLIAGNDPVDQYLLRHPDYFFRQSPEHAVVDPENPYVLASHLQAAAFELPLDAGDVARFGPLASPIAEVLGESGRLSEVGGKHYFSGEQNPSARISLRHMSDNTFSIVLRATTKGAPRDAGLSARGESQVIANVDAISAPELVYPEAVYLHNGESYFVRELDLVGKVAYVERHEMDYYTQAVLESNVKLKTERKSSGALPTALVAFGDVDVSWQTVAFKKIKFGTRENIGMGPVEIPAQTLGTTALWLAPDENARRALKEQGFRASEGVCGLRNLAVVALPIVAMCDSRDLGGVVDSQNLGRSAMILYDRYPGGLGYCERGFQQINELLEICRAMVSECPCEAGCPSCVGLPSLRRAIHSDPDLTRGYPMPNKQATQALIEQLLASPLSATADSPRPVAVAMAD